VSFERPVGETVQSGQRLKLTGLVSKGKLPDAVGVLDDLDISWSVVVDGDEAKPVQVGVTGRHRIYVTLDTPFGKMQSPVNNLFQESGPDQVVTDWRLYFSTFSARGKTTEKDCVDALFNFISFDRRVGYVLDHRWENDPLNNTHVMPKPSLHHYLWLCNNQWLSSSDPDAQARVMGECHNIAAAFILANRILGVKGPMEVGYMYPWPSRAESHPTYPKRGDHILGKYNQRYTRPHSGEGHGSENLLFLDGGDFANNFEGVAKYGAAALYAIGDAVFDLFGSPDENASAYYAKRPNSGPNATHPTPADVNLDIGLFDLIFFDETNGGGCVKPYPWVTGALDHHGILAATFRWHE